MLGYIIINFILVLVCTCFEATKGAVNESAVYSNLQSGYWKIADAGTSAIKCPYDINSCHGGETGGDSSCDQLFEGFLCAESVDGNYIDWTFRDSMPCDTKMVAMSIILSLLLALVLPLYICCCIGVVKAKKADSSKSLELVTLKNSKSPRVLSSRSLFSENDYSPDRDRDAPMDFVDFSGLSKPNDQVTVLAVTDEHNNRVLNFLVKLKILIFAVQVTCSLPNSLLTPLPEGTSQLLRVFSFMSWASLQALPLKCISIALNVQHVTYPNSAEIATVLPVMSFIVVLVLYCVHIELVYLIKTNKHFKILQKRLSIRYGTVVCMFVYIVQGGVHSLLFGSFGCIEADPDDLVAGRQYVMRNDVSVDCTSASFQYGYLWAVVCVLLFAVAVPVVQATILTFYKWSVAKDLAQLANNTVSAPSTPRTPRTVDEWDSGSQSTFGGDYSIVPSDTPSRSVLMQQQRDRRSGSTSGSSGRHSRGSRLQEEDMRKKRKQKDRLAQFYDAVCIMHMAYKPAFKYFELSDHAARIFFMALLPVLSPDNTHAQIMIALVAAIICLLRVVNARPYLLEDNQLLATVGLGQIVIVLLGVLAIQIDAAGGFSDSLIVFDAVMCISVLATPLLFIYQVWLRELSCFARFKTKQTAVVEANDSKVTEFGRKSGTFSSRETTPQRSVHTPSFGTPRSALTMTPPHYSPSYSPTTSQPLLLSAARPMSIQQHQRALSQSHQHVRSFPPINASPWFDTSTSLVDHNANAFNSTLTDPYYSLENTQVEAFQLPPPPPSQLYRPSQLHMQQVDIQEQYPPQMFPQQTQQYADKVTTHHQRQYQDRMTQDQFHSEAQYRGQQQQRHCSDDMYDSCEVLNEHKTDVFRDSRPLTDYIRHSHQQNHQPQQQQQQQQQIMSRPLPPSPHRRSPSDGSRDLSASHSSDTRPASASVNYDMYYNRSPQSVRANKTFYENPFSGDDRSANESTPPTSSNASYEQILSLQAKQGVVDQHQQVPRPRPPPLTLDRPLKLQTPPKAPPSRQPYQYSPPQQDEQCMDEHVANQLMDDNESVYAQYSNSRVHSTERDTKPSLQQQAHSLAPLSRAKSFNSTLRKPASSELIPPADEKVSRSAKTTSSAGFLSAITNPSGFRFPNFFSSPAKDIDTPVDSPAMLALFGKPNGSQKTHTTIARDDDVNSALSGSDNGDDLYGLAGGEENGHFNPADCFDDLLEECFETERQLDLGYYSPEEEEEGRSNKVHQIVEAPRLPVIVHLNDLDGQQISESQTKQLVQIETKNSRGVEADQKRRQVSELRKSVSVEVPAQSPPLVSSVSQKVRRIESSVKQGADQKNQASASPHHNQSFRKQLSSTGNNSEGISTLPSLEVDTRNIHVRSEVNEETGRVERYRYNEKSSRASGHTTKETVSSARSSTQSGFDFDLPSDTVSSTHMPSVYSFPKDTEVSTRMSTTTSSIKSNVAATPTSPARRTLSSATIAALQVAASSISQPVAVQPVGIQGRTPPPRPPPPPPVQSRPVSNDSSVYDYGYFRDDRDDTSVLLELAVIEQESPQQLHKQTACYLEESVDQADEGDDHSWCSNYDLYANNTAVNNYIEQRGRADSHSSGSSDGFVQEATMTCIDAGMVTAEVIQLRPHHNGVSKAVNKVMSFLPTKGRKY